MPEFSVNDIDGAHLVDDDDGLARAVHVQIAAGRAGPRQRRNQISE
jgi:hypothetical protein